MSYVGSTAASTVANPPNRVTQGLMSQSNYNESTSISNGGSLWTYNSSNLTTDLVVANFFSDGHTLGMRNGDILIANTYSTESSTGQIVIIGTIVGLSTSGASMSSEGFISSTATAAGGG